MIAIETLHQVKFTVYVQRAITKTQSRVRYNFTFNTYLMLFKIVSHDLKVHVKSATFNRMLVHVFTSSLVKSSCPKQT